MLWHIVKKVAVASLMAVSLAACHDAHTLDAGVNAQYHGATGVLLDQEKSELLSSNPESPVSTPGLEPCLTVPSTWG